MEKEFVTYNQALKLKALGFDKPCFGWYKLPNKRLCGEYEMVTFQNNYPHIKFIETPTFSQAFRWFREKHNWQNSIDPTADQHSRQLGYNYWIWNYTTGEEYHTMPKNRPTGDWEYETYEEAEIACLTKLIEIVESK